MRLALAAAFAAGLAACGPAMAQNGRIEIVQPWARATPGGARTGAVYLTIRSPVADRLVGLSSPVAKAALLHEDKMSQTVMRMRALAAVPVSAGQEIVLAPGGIHIMLVGLAAPLVAGQTFPLTLSFAKAGRQTVTVAVGPVGAMAPPVAPR